MLQESTRNSIIAGRPAGPCARKRGRKVRRLRHNLAVAAEGPAP